MTLSCIKFMVIHLQHCFLELKGYLNYVCVYHPIMLGEAASATTISKCIDAFVLLDANLPRFVHAGIPVWIIKPFNLLSAICIDKDILPCQGKDWTAKDTSPPSKVFFMGQSDDSAKYWAYKQFSRRFMGLPNPFDSQAPPPPTSTSSSSPMPPSTAPNSVASSSSLAKNSMQCKSHGEDYKGSCKFISFTQ